MRILALSGILLFIYFFIKDGPVNIWERIKDLSFINFLILFGLRLVYWSVRSFNWHMILRTSEGSPGFLKAFHARLGSHSVGYLTPTAKIGGEVIRVFLLEDIDKRKIAASVIIDKMCEYLASIVIVGSGVVTSILILDLNMGFKCMLLGLTFFLIGILIFFFRKQKEGFLMWFRKKIRIGDKYFSDKEIDIKKTDEYISGFYKYHKKVFYLVSSIYFLNYLLWIFEIFLTLLFLGSLSISLFKSFIIATLGSFAFIFPLLPGSLGIFEVTYLGLFKLLGIATTIGISYIIIRRILGLLLAGIGLVPVFKSGFKKQ